MNAAFNHSAAILKFAHENHLESSNKSRCPGHALGQLITLSWWCGWGRRQASVHLRAGDAMCSQVENHSSARASACPTCLHRTRFSVWTEPLLPKCTFHFNLIFKIRIIKRLLCHGGHVMGIGMEPPLAQGPVGCGPMKPALCSPACICES